MIFLSFPRPPSRLLVGLEVLCFYLADCRISLRSKDHNAQKGESEGRFFMFISIFHILKWSFHFLFHFYPFSIFSKNSVYIPWDIYISITFLSIFLAPASRLFQPGVFLFITPVFPLFFNGFCRLRHFLFCPTLTITEFSGPSLHPKFKKRKCRRYGKEDFLRSR